MIAWDVRTNNGLIVDGPLLIKPDVYLDERGYFYESWNQLNFNNIVGKDVNFVQDNHSKSKKGVLRGLHYQVPKMAQGKLIRCTLGSVFDVAVDIRKSSSTFKKWVSVKLSDCNNFLFWIPEGFAHGFLTITETAEVQYKSTNFWDKDSERAILWNDKSINIEWPLESFEGLTPSLGPKDCMAPCFDELNWVDDLFN